MVRSETMLRWHRKGWRLYWTWRSRAHLGRPHLSREVRDLIARMSKENPLWGTERTRGEVLKLGIVVSNRSIRRYHWRPIRPEVDHPRWRPFLRNQLRGIWAAHLFVVQTIDGNGFTSMSPPARGPPGSGGTSSKQPNSVDSRSS